MKRVLGIVLFGVGVALAVFAAGLRFYVTPAGTNIPYDLEASTTIAEATNGHYLTASGPEDGTLLSYTDVVPNAAATNELTGDDKGKYVVWDVYDKIQDASSGALVDAGGTFDVKLDRKTGEVEGTGGYIYKLPFNTEKKTYSYYDGTLGKLHDLKFVAVETVSGLEAYKFEGSLTGPFKHPVAGDATYEVTRTIWVEPVTGQFLNVKQSVKIATTSTVLLSGDFEYTQETKDNAKATIEDNRNLILLVSQYLPIGGGAAGIILIVVGIILFAAKPKEKTEAPAPAAA